MDDSEAVAGVYFRKVMAQTSWYKSCWPSRQTLTVEVEMTGNGEFDGDCEMKSAECASFFKTKRVSFIA